MSFPLISRHISTDALAGELREVFDAVRHGETGGDGSTTTKTIQVTEQTYM